MGGKTSIEWTDSTWNPVSGCTKVSDGCRNCYAEAIGRRFAGTSAWPNGFGVTCHPERLAIPLRWRKGRRVFVCSTGDLFHESVSLEFIDRVFAVMACCDGTRCSKPRHVFQVLTKRPERMLAYLSDPETPWRVHSQFVHDITVPGWYPQPFGSLDTAPWMPWPQPNVWLGVTAENREEWDRRVSVLRDVPAALRFVSHEPALGPLGDVDLAGIGWVIAGGETGPKARPMHPDWARSLRDQCAAARVPFFFKQWGEWLPIDQIAADGYQSGGFGRQSVRDRIWTVHWGRMPEYEPKKDSRLGFSRVSSVYRHADPRGVGGVSILRIGKRAAGHLLDGVGHRAFPTRGER